mmetsp:Transcript_23929/g.43917  ORF Transcript_23929/g.43917 Transcript_23929/m.43917 type:complete len:219 (-) Transcript_23929:1168-1824(-)
MATAWAGRPYGGSCGGGGGAGGGAPAGLFARGERPPFFLALLAFPSLVLGAASNAFPSLAALGVVAESWSSTDVVGSAVLGPPRGICAAIATGASRGGAGGLNRFSSSRRSVRILDVASPTLCSNDSHFLCSSSRKVWLSALICWNTSVIPAAALRAQPCACSSRDWVGSSREQASHMSYLQLPPLFWLAKPPIMACSGMDFANVSMKAFSIGVTSLR